MFLDRSARSRIAVSGLLLLALTSPALAQSPGERSASVEANGWTPDAMIQVRRVAQVRPSPDGRHVAYTVAEAVMTDDRSEYVSQIWMANADGSEASQLTFGPKSSTNPLWSPDGKFLAFTSERTGKSNLFRMRVAGGEAEQLTDVKTGVGTFAWSPDGSQIAFLMSDPPGDTEEKGSKSRDDARWVDRDFKMERLYLLALDQRSRTQMLSGNRPSAGGQAHFAPKAPQNEPVPGGFRIASQNVAATGKFREPRKLTNGNFTIGAAARPGGGTFDWSPDGKSIVFSHRITPRADDWPTADISLVDVASGKLTPLATTKAAEFSPMFSPDGKSVVYVASDDPPRWAGSFTFRIANLADGKSRDLPETYDRQPSLIGWSADGSKIYFVETHGTLNRLQAMQVDSGKLTDLYAGQELLRSIELNETGTKLGMVMESPTRAPEAAIASCDSFLPVRVSKVNADLPELPLGKVEVVRWSSPDGQQIEGLLTYPVGYQAGTKVPLLLQIHGGPMGVFLQSFPGNAGIYPNAAFSARGFAMLQPNPRGSSGYGQKFRYANIKDWGGGDFADLMAGVDHVIGMGVADPDCLGVMGWSYGGYMTSWTITQTRRFKAASVGAAVTNLVSFTGTADIPGFLPDYFGTQPWGEAPLYRERSAVFQAQGVTTPALIQHGESDVRVPISQGYEFYNALKQQGTPVEMLVLPRQPHGPTEPRMLLKLMQTNLDWFEKHLRPEQLSGTDKTPDFRELEQIAEQELKQSRTPGAAIGIVQGNRLIYSKGFGLANVETGQPVTPQMLFRMGSTTKMFTAAALVSLADEGKIDLHGPIGERISNLHPAIAALTPHQLLTHTAGLTDESIMSGLHDDSALAAGIRKMDESWLFTPAGSVHSYSNPGYWIAGLACEQVAGKPYAEVLRERLFQPLGMQRTTLRPTEAMTWPLALGHEVRNGVPAIVRPQADNAATWPAGQMYSSVEELARFVIAFLNAGQLDGQMVLNRRLLEQLATAYVPRPGSEDHYGYGLTIGNYRGVQIVSHGGSRSGYGSTIRMAPEHRVGVIVLANRTGSSLPRTAAKALELMLLLEPETATGYASPQELTEQEIARLKGTYTNHRQTVELFERDGKLLIRRKLADAPPGNAEPVVKRGDQWIAAASQGAGEATNSIYIVRNEDGQVLYLCIGSRALKKLM